MLKLKGSSKSKLILDSSSSSGSETEEIQVRKEKRKKSKDKKKEDLTINKDYATRYDSWRNLEEMQKLKDRLGVSDINELNNEESSESSEEEVEWTPEQEEAFFKTYAILKMKDPSIYNKDFSGFFKNEKGEEDAGKEKKKKKKDDKKPFTVKDHERVMVLERGGQISDEEDDEGDAKMKGPKSYNEELASIKNEFSKALNDIESSDDDEDGKTLLGSNLLKQKQRTKEEKEREDEKQKKWLKGELDKLEEGKLSKEYESQLKFLKQYWSDEKLDEGEKFLRDYILNEKYIEQKDKDDDSEFGDNDQSFSGIIQDDELSNDEKFEAEREEFEHKYNFRFEEPDQEFIKRYPRTIADSLRREDTKRKEQRQKAKEKREEMISKKKEEVQRLKAFKRKEIMDKIQKLHEITGDPNLELTEMDIDGDFDPEEYDRRMQQIFNEEYYQEGDEEKPEFPYDEELDDEEIWDEWVPAREAKSKRNDDLEQSEEEEDDDEEDVPESVDDEEEEAGTSTRRSRAKKKVEQELIESSKGKRGRRKRSAFLDALEREKPKFDPKVHKSFEQYFDEYYKLDFEDVVGDLKTRFKYHKTVPNDFGLTTDEILTADDKELNKWASIKKTFQYRDDREEENDVLAYKQKSQQQHVKKRIFLSLYDPTTGLKTTDQQSKVSGGESLKQKKKKNKKNKNTKNQDQTSSNNGTIGSDSVSSKANSSTKTEESGSSSSPKKNKKSNNESNSIASASTPNPSSDTTPAKLSKRQRKIRSKMLKKQQMANGGGDAKSLSTNGASESKVNSQPQNTSKSENKEGKKNKKHFKRKVQDSNDANSSGLPVDEERLRAYGLNPKKFAKRMKYAPGSKK